jgi:hypothetical protein
MGEFRFRRQVAGRNDISTAVRIQSAPSSRVYFPLRFSLGWITPALFLTCAGLAPAQQRVQPLPGAPLPGLSAVELARFEAGKAAFAHSPTLAEGAGPIFNGTVIGYGGGCIHCHNAPDFGGGGGIVVTRFGVAASGSNPFDPLIALGGPVLQQHSLTSPCLESVPPQADLITHRVSPPTFGFGLIEATLDADILVREVFPPAGVSGRANLATPGESPLGPPVVGRFGWKAQVPTLLTFSADAMVNELGVTNRLFPLENTPNGPPAANGPCDTVADPEDGPDAQGLHRIDRLSDFMRLLAAPPQTPKSGMTGEVLFNGVGCASCHVSAPYSTSPAAPDAALRSKSFKPYSDFLLHDMGALGDGFPDGMATGSEFRTTPLWGVSYRARLGLLHDDRVNGAAPEGNLHDAILAHGGEATATVAAYSALSPNARLEIQQFLMSLGRAEFDYDFSYGPVTINDIDWYFMRLDVTGPGSFFDADDPRAVADFDADGDIDLRDIAGLQRAFTGG